MFWNKTWQERSFSLKESSAGFPLGTLGRHSATAMCHLEGLVGMRCDAMRRTQMVCLEPEASCYVSRSAGFNYSIGSVG